MKNTRIASFARVLLAVSAFGIFMAPAARADMPNVGIVNMQKLGNESAAGKDLQAQLDKQRDALHDEAVKHEQELKKIEDGLAAQKDKLPPKEFAAKVGDYQKKLAETRDLIRGRQAAVGKGADEALAQLRKAIDDVVKEIAAEKKLDLVLPSQDVLFNQPSMDITDDARSRLDKKLSNIKLNVGK